MEELKEELEESLERELEEKEKKFCVSFSKISTYLSCGLKYYYRYVKGIVTPFPASVLAGQCLHRTVEKILKEKKEGSILSFEDAKDFYLDLARELVATRGVIAISDREKEEGVGSLVRRYLKFGLRALKVFYEARIVKMSPEDVVGIEYPLFFDALEMCYLFFDESEIEEMRIAENLENVFVVGYVDYIYRDQICEIKTTSRFFENFLEKYLNQVSLYAAGYLKDFGFYPEGARLDVLVLPDGSEGIVRYLAGVLKIKEENVERQFRRMNLAVSGIKKGVFLAPVSGYVCKNFCAYKEMGICKFFA